VDIDIHDPAVFEGYRKVVGALIAKHGGEYLVRGGEFEVIEPGRHTLIGSLVVRGAHAWVRMCAHLETQTLDSPAVRC
jgi:uncharacterized protein (DUF1330 family)